MAYKGYRYVEEERRRRWAPAAATYKMTLGWADPRHRAASLVVVVLLCISTPSSSFLVRLAARPSAAAGGIESRSKCLGERQEASDILLNEVSDAFGGRNGLSATSRGS